MEFPRDSSLKEWSIDDNHVIDFDEDLLAKLKVDLEAILQEYQPGSVAKSELERFSE